MARTFIYQDDSSHKFWSIDVTETSFTVTFGKVGTAGQTQTKTFESEDACRLAADKLIAEKMKKGYVEGASTAETSADAPDPKALRARYVKEYEDVEDEDASSYYYGEGNAMSRLLITMQTGIDEARAKYEERSGFSSSDDVSVGHGDDDVEIYINEDKLELEFSMGENVFFRYSVGAPMAEALVLMEKMDDSGMSTSMGQAINNWVEDLNFSGFGMYSVSDSWFEVEGAEGYDDDDDDGYDY